MDLRGFEAVVAVHEHGSFSAAAIHLFVTQSALTRRIALLERELGERLFTRSARGSVLTDAGLTMIEHARGVLRETEIIRSIVGELHADPPGESPEGDHPRDA